MNAEVPWRIILVAEGPSDQKRVGLLVDYFLKKNAAVTTHPDALRRFEGLSGESYIKIRDIPRMVRERGFDRRYSQTGPKKGDGNTLRQLYNVLKKEKLLTPETVILWARDDDGHPSRRDEVSATRDDLPNSTPILFAIASECGEAWVIAGWNPTTITDAAKLKELRQDFGFAPHTHPERLSHKEDVPKSAKVVVKKLFENDEEQETDALIRAALSDSPASVACGLHAFRKELEDWLSRSV